MRASQARWALVLFSTLGLAGCQTGKPTWWPGRNKTPAYSTSSTTPPAGAVQHPLPSSQASPYGMEGQQDANQYAAQQTSGVAGGADAYGGNGYGANNYAAATGQDGYGNATAGVPQSGPYDNYQQPAGGGYTGAAGGQVNNPYAGAGAGGAGYNDYQAQQQGGYATQQTAGGYQTAGAGQTGGGYQTAGGYQSAGGYQGGAATEPAGGNPAYTADARYGQPQGYDNAAYSGANSQYNTAGAGYVGGATTPEQSPYSQASDAAWSQGATTPGNTGYQPGNTGYNPPGTQPYQSPAGNYNPDNGTQADPHYRPGGTSDYTPGAGGATNSAATSYAATAAGNSGAGGYADTGAATANRYPSATTSTSRYPSSPTEDRYGRPTTANASAAGTTGGYYPQR